MVRTRHRDYFLLLAEETIPKLRGAEQMQWYAVLEAEHDNLRQGLTFCLEETEGGENGLRLAGVLPQFWETRGHLSGGRSRLTAGRWYLLILTESNLGAIGQIVIRLRERTVS